MASFNRVILIGNLTRDVELRYIPSGTAVADIGLAVNDRVKRGDQWEDEVTFVTCTLWGRTAEVANEYASKGRSVLVEGRLKMDSYEKDGQKRTTLKVIAEKFQLLGSKSDRQSQPESREAAAVGAGEESGESDPFETDSIPF